MDIGVCCAVTVVIFYHLPCAVNQNVRTAHDRSPRDQSLRARGASPAFATSRSLCRAPIALFPGKIMVLSACLSPTLEQAYRDLGVDAIHSQRATGSVDLPMLPRVWIGTTRRCLISEFEVVAFSFMDVGACWLFKKVVGMCLVFAGRSRRLRLLRQCENLASH